MVTKFLVKLYHSTPFGFAHNRPSRFVYYHCQPHIYLFESHPSITTFAGTNTKLQISPSVSYMEGGCSVGSTKSAKRSDLQMHLLIHWDSTSSSLHYRNLGFQPSWLSFLKKTHPKGLFDRMSFKTMFYVIRVVTG